MFKEIFTEFAGVIKNDKFNVEVGDEVVFKHQDTIYYAIVTELENGKHGKAIIASDEFERPILTHASMLKHENDIKNVKEIKTIKFA